MITYCTNIHPAESWQETFDYLQKHIPGIKAAVSPKDDFPIGLRLSNRAALALSSGERDQFEVWCRENQCFVPTINGFPFGAFFGASIKENVYLPDWRDPERAAYTCRLAELLHRWLPDGMTGAISTVPLGFKSKVGWDDQPSLMKNVVATLEHLDALRQQTGKRVILALEPEPGCLLETAKDILRFFEPIHLGKAPYDLLGICFDCCHQAVMFEDPKSALASIQNAGIPVPKVHVSSGLRMTKDARSTLEGFDEPTYLHQVVVRRAGGTLLAYSDISEALATHVDAAQDEWRVHFHVPVFYDSEGSPGTTRFFTEEVIRQIGGKCLLEVETYTWSVLPPELSLECVDESIVREVLWVRDALHAE